MLEARANACPVQARPTAHDSFRTCVGEVGSLVISTLQVSIAQVRTLQAVVTGGGREPAWRGEGGGGGGVWGTGNSEAGQ